VSVDYGEPTDLYRLYDEDGVLLYVGITNNWPRRRSMHMQDKSWWGEVCQVTFERFHHRTQAERAEPVVIKSERPRYNHVHAMVSPRTRSYTRRSLRVVLRYGRLTLIAQSKLDEIVKRHPGEVLLEVQSRGVLDWGHVSLTPELYHDLDRFCRGRAATYGVVTGIAGSSIARKHIDEILDGGAA
jgi:predicted GIY-YIG superfamily endonuclease